MARWLWVGLLGVALLAPAVLEWAWVWISDPVRPADAEAAFQRLAAVSLSKAGGEKSAEATVILRSDASWKRIVRNWGDPGYFIGAVSPERKHDILCLKDLGVSVKARIGDKLVVLGTADAPPYGYSIDCRPAGLLFRSPPGSIVTIDLAVARDPHQAADLVVEPYWTVGTKDRLVGIGIEEDLHLRAVAMALAFAGIIAICIAAFLFSHRMLRPAG